LDQKDPAIALNYAIFLYNKSSQEIQEEENSDEIYADAISKIQLFETRVKYLREGASGMDADPDVLMAANSLAKEMEYKLTISTPSIPETSGKFEQHQQLLISTGSATGAISKRLTSSAAVKSARATYKRQMKEEQAAVEESFESSKGLEESVDNNEENNAVDEVSNHYEPNNNN
jgi:hypothetical protein